MKRLYKYIIPLCLSVILSDEITLIGDSAPFIADTKYPILEWIAPEVGDQFNGNETIVLEWDIEEESLQSGLVSIYFSTTLSPQFDLIFSSLGNEESVYYTLPDISTDFARFKVTVEDDFGYYSEVASEYFTINGSGGDDGGDDGGQSEDELVLIGDSEPFIADTQPPEVELLYPNSGESFNQGQAVNVSWSATDESLGDNPISIFLTVNQGATYELQAESIANTGVFTATLPMQDTEYGRFKVTVIDFFGYESIDEADGYFSIGAINEYVITDTSLVLESDSESFRTDTVDPVITVIYPNGGEHIADYQNVNLQWTVVDESIENYECSASVASQLGGYYTMINDDIPIYGYENTYDINMAVEGVMETLWARLQMDVVDDFGNSSTDKSDGYFILGSPEGELSTEQLGEEDIIILDWGWQIGHLIAMHEDAVSFLNEGDQIEIVDYHGIINESCESAYGEVILESFTYSGEAGHLAFKALCGSDLCEEGGSRYPGYIAGNDIILRYTDAITDEVLLLAPNLQLVTGALTFDDEITIIYGFDNTDGRSAGNSRPVNRNPLISDNSGMAVLTDGRDFDSYNVYRTTNQANLRDCEDEEGCTLVEGECQCLIANNVPQSYYFDNYASEQEEWCYDVWLLDNQTDQNEILKTVDSCMGTEVDLLFGDANDDGIINILDVVGIVAFILGNTTFSEIGEIQADFNQDGIINILDVVGVVYTILNF